AGIDCDKLKEKAIAKGILAPEKAEAMSEREALRLIFAPGFSTAKEVTDVSGRGVGMDVVRTNIAKLGGTVDVESTLGEGSAMIVTLPLTLAIIPSLIVQAGGDRFAIPQVNISELVRVRGNERETRLGRVKDAEVLRLRGSLLPLVRLRDALGCQDTNPSADTSQPAATDNEATNIIVVDTGQTRFGMVVDGLHDSEEIVVKPLGRHHKNCRCLAGATILGDGHVALILDAAGIASEVDLRAEEQAADPIDPAAEEEKAALELQSTLLFDNSETDHFALPMEVIARIERVKSEDIHLVGGCEFLQYQHSTLPLLRLEQCLHTTPPEELSSVYVVVFEARGREIGLVAPRLRDIRQVPTNFDTITFRESGVTGSLVIEDRTTLLLDVFELTETVHPEWLPQEELQADVAEGLPPLVLLAEDSAFFRGQVQSIFESKGYRVEPCEDGLQAWEKLESGEYDFNIVVTDIEMPNMDGFELCRRLKDHPATKHLPVIALTSLAAATDIQRGVDVGIDDYQIKMDREKLLNSLRNFCDPAGGSGANKNTPAEMLV
ncbi:MAG: chemotaxis protein CheW, partial [Planctomycetota bacterium]